MSAEVPRCAVCDLAIVLTEPHGFHEEDCERVDGWCVCEGFVHPGCCPVCLREEQEMVSAREALAVMAGTIVGTVFGLTIPSGDGGELTVKHETVPMTTPSTTVPVIAEIEGQP